MGMRHLLAYLLLAFASCSLSSAQEERAVFEVFRAIPVFESEDSRRLARRKLGCDPCQEVSSRDGVSEGSGQALIDPDAGVAISSDQILSVHQDRTEPGIIVYVRLREDAQESIRGLRASFQDRAATFVAGELITIGPIEMVDGNFVIALVQSPALAEEIASSLR